jgi:hypothetical protein
MVAVNGGTLASGDGVGTLSAGPTTFQSGGVFEVEIAGNNDTASDRDQLVVAGVLNFVTSGGGSTVRVLQAAGSFDRTTTHTYTIASTGAPVQVDGSGSASLGGITLDTSQLVSPGSFSLSRSGNLLVLTFQPVPEPAFPLLCAAAGVGVAEYRRRRHAAAKRR